MSELCGIPFGLQCHLGPVLKCHEERLLERYTLGSGNRLSLSFLVLGRQLNGGTTEAARTLEVWFLLGIWEWCRGSAPVPSPGRKLRGQPEHHMRGGSACVTHRGCSAGQNLWLKIATVIYLLTVPRPGLASRTGCWSCCWSLGRLCSSGRGLWAGSAGSQGGWVAVSPRRLGSLPPSSMV